MKPSQRRGLMEPTRAEIIDILKITHVFADLPPEIHEDLAGMVSPVRLQREQLVFAEGDTGDSLYIIATGRIGLESKGQLLREIGRGEIFGEMSLLDLPERNASAVVLENALLLRLAKAPFLELVHDHSSLMFGLVLEFERRLRSYMNDLRNLREHMEKVILPLGIELATETNIDRLVERILVEALRLCNADAGALYLKDDDGALSCVAAQVRSKDLAYGGTTGQDPQFPPIPFGTKQDGNTGEKQDVVARVATKGTVFTCSDIYNDETVDSTALAKFDASIGYRTESYLAVPLKDRSGGVAGILQLVNALDPVTGTVIPFGGYEQLVVESLASHAAAAINVQTVMRKQEDLLKLERDLHVARRIQAGFLPRSLPNVPGWEIAASFTPAREVAGDFYDAFMMSQNRRIGFVIADVVDKGVPAALFMALVRSLTRAFAQQNYSIDWTSMLSGEDSKRSAKGQARAMPSTGTISLYNAVLLTNNYIVDNHSDDNMFATLFFGMLNPMDGQLAYVNAGHNPPLVLSASGQVKTKLNNTGTAVGMFRDVTFGIETTQLEPGDLLFTYTDGVTEARNVGGDFLTEHGLIQLLDRPVATADESLRFVVQNLEEFMRDAVQADDITMLAIRRALE